MQCENEVCILEGQAVYDITCQLLQLQYVSMGQTFFRAASLKQAYRVNGSFRHTRKVKGGPYTSVKLKHC